MTSASTLGEAHDLGWRITAVCSKGKRSGMKAIPECMARIDLDMPTLVWTRGRNFPLTLLASRLKCIRCGSPHVRVIFSPPSVYGANRVAVSGS